MHRLLLILTVMGLIALPTVWVNAQAVSSQTDGQVEDYYNLPLCLPGMPADGTCLMYGPAQTVAEMEAEGFPYPPMDLAAAVPPAELGVLPVFVAKINLPSNEPAPIYASFEDAVAGVNAVSQIDAGSLRYISYVNRLDQDGNAFVQLSSGGWLRASPAAYTDFQGLLFFDNPRNDFGWIVDQTPSYKDPNFGAQLTGKNYTREAVIQVFNTIESEGVFWYQIAMDEWVNSLKARVISVDTNKPEGVNTNRWIEINLLQQILVVYEDGKLQFATLLSSGLEPWCF